MTPDQVETNELVAEHDEESQGNVDAPMLDVRSPMANLAVRDNIVPDGPGTIEDFIHP
jgi:hypothetical protein